MRSKPIQKLMVVLFAIVMSLSLGASPAFARGGGGGGGGGSHASVSSGSHSAPVSRASTGRSTTAPKSSSSSGRSTKAPARTGSNAPRSAARTTRATAGRVTVSRTTRVTGSSYSVGGHTYTYRTTSYYRTFRGGYPAYGSSNYWMLYNDPFYYSNYRLIGNPWYGHQYPVGYNVQGGQFAQQGGSLAWPWIVLIVLVAGGAVTYVVIRRRNGRTFADKL